MSGEPHSTGLNSRQEALEPKRAPPGQPVGLTKNVSFLEPLKSPRTASSNSFSKSAVPIDNLGKNAFEIRQTKTIAKYSEFAEQDIIESVAWTQKLDKFLKKPSISTLLETYVNPSIVGGQHKKATITPSIPIKPMEQPSSKSISMSMKQSLSKNQSDNDMISPNHSVGLDTEFLNQADSADRILSIASNRRLSQIELEAVRNFTRSSALSSAWDDEPDVDFDPSISIHKNNRRFGRRSGLQFPPIGTHIALQKVAITKKEDSSQLSQRSDISVPAYLFDEDKSSKVLPDFGRIEKRRNMRQRELNMSGVASILAPNAESDSDPCSDECEGLEKERVSLLNAHKPTLISTQTGIETVDHDELNAYSDFAYAASYHQAFAAEVAFKSKNILSKHQLRNSDHESRSSLISSAKSVNKSQEASVFVPDTSTNWKTSMEMPDVASSEYCRFCILHKLPIYHTIIRASLTHSHHKNVSFAGENIQAVSHYFKHAAKTIQELVIASCSVGNDEFRFLGASCFRLMSALTCLKLVDCNFCDGGNLLQNSFALLSSLSSIQISDCKLRDSDCASALIGLTQNNSKCTHISVDHNFASAVSADAISKCFRFSKCLWQDIDLSWNRMSPSWNMCSSLRHCDSLTAINLSWNGLRDEVALSAMCYALRFHPRMRHINLQNCGLCDRHAMLLTELLCDCVSLVSIDLRNNSIHSYGCRSILRVLGLRHQSAQKDAQPITSDPGQPSNFGICHVMLPISGVIPDSVVDYDVIAGPVEFSLRSPSDRHILKSLLYKREKELVKFTDDSFQIDDDFVPAVKLKSMINAFETRDSRLHNDLGVITDLRGASSDHKIEQSYEFDKITLTIQNLIQNPTEDRLATAWEIAFVKQIHASSEFSMEQKMFFVSFLLGGSNVFTLEQLQELVFLIKPGYRVDAVKLALTHCWERNRSEFILGWLSTSEQQKVEMHVSEECLHFAPNNPTGHYRLLLSSRFDRDICFKLLAMRNNILDVMKRDKTYQSSRHKVEKVALNVKFEGIPFTITPDWNVPSNGTLELDFVYCLHPDPSAFPVIDDQSVFDFTLAPVSAQRKQLKILRSLSNEHYFTCTQAMRIMQYFCDPAMKVESLVILFSRVIDYPGFMRVVKALDGTKQLTLRKRLGAHNLYSDCTAVGFHELDLTDPQQRFICGRLVDLAIIEPGENMCACRYNEIDFDVPSSWLEEVPQKGVFSVFYCRSAQVIKKIFQTSPLECIPANLDVISPAGVEWVQQAKRVRIKLKLSLAFTNVEEAFNKMDEDGGGSLSRLEFSRGLRMLGVQVTAYELLDLVDLLDEDGSGFIELEEMVAFWESC